MRLMAFGHSYSIMTNPPPLNEVKGKAPCTCRGCLPYLCVMALSFLMVFFTAAVITYVMPKKFESTLVYQLRPSTRVGFSLSQPHSPQHFATEFEVIRASLTLKPVVQKLNLTTRWNMTEEDAVALLRGTVVSQNIKGTDLVEIRVRHTDAEEARDIAREVFLSYKTRREDKERELMELGLKELEKAIQDQTDLVEDKRKLREQLKEDAPQQQIQELQEELATQQEMLDRMSEKLTMDRINYQQSMESVILHEEPIVARIPCSPNVKLNLSLGAAAGVLLGLFISLLMRLFQGRCKCRTT